jgi:hypothetical protein
VNKTQLQKAVEGQVADGGFAGLGWPAAKAKKANAIVDRVTKRNASVAQAMIENGRDLIELKGMCEHGEFEAAVKVKIGVSKQYAAIQIAAYRWADQNRLTDAKDNPGCLLENIDVRAIKLLASKKGSIHTEQAIDLASNGTRVTEGLVKGWISEVMPISRPAAKDEVVHIESLDDAWRTLKSLPKRQLIDELINLMLDAGLSVDDLMDRMGERAREVA